MAPALALVNDTDVILAGYAGGVGNEGKHLEVVQQALHVRAGRREPSALTGYLADSLKSVPRDACGLLIGEVPTAVRSELSDRRKLLSFAPDLVDLAGRGPSGSRRSFRWKP
jgi:hypothetical protein